VKTFKGKPYAIAFDTLEMPGTVVCVSVQLSKLIIRPNDSVRVDLVDHPLYPQLCQYVRDNPPAPKEDEATP
jgi:hypothetical protein